MGYSHDTGTGTTLNSDRKVHVVKDVLQEGLIRMKSSHEVVYVDFVIFTSPGTFYTKRGENAAESKTPIMRQYGPQSRGAGEGLPYLTLKGGGMGSPS